MIAQQRQHAIFRLDLRPKDTVIVGEANKPTQFFQLAIQMANRFGNRMVDLVCLVFQKGRTFAVKFADKTIKVDFFVTQTCQKSAAQQICGSRGDLDDAAIHSLCVFRHSDNGTHRIERKEAAFLVTIKSSGEFFVGVAFKNTAQKAIKSRIILINNFFPGHNVHPTESKSESCCTDSEGS